MKDSKFLNQILHKLFDDDNLCVRTEGHLHPLLNLVEMQVLSQYRKRNSQTNE